MFCIKKLQKGWNFREITEKPVTKFFFSATLLKKNWIVVGALQILWNISELLSPVNGCFTADIYLFKVNNGNAGIICEFCSKLIIKTTEQHQCHSGVIIANFEQKPQIAHTAG